MEVLALRWGATLVTSFTLVWIKIAGVYEHDGGVVGHELHARVD